MELADCIMYQYNNSIEQELEPTEVDDLSGVSWPHSENEEIHQDLLQDVIKINQIDNLTKNTGMTERTYTTDLIRGEDIEISIDGHNCIAHIDNGSGMTIMTLETFGELRGKIAKPMTYFKEEQYRTGRFQCGSRFTTRPRTNRTHTSSRSPTITDGF